MNEKGALVPANIFDKVTYHLHPSFGERATQGMFWSLLVFFDLVLATPGFSVSRIPRPARFGRTVALCVLVFRLEANVG